jgi:nitroreductase
MGVLDIISSRRSIRKYKADTIPEEALRQILQAGILAPSGNNRQTWNFYVVQGKKREEMVSRLMEGLANREKEGEDLAGVKHSFDIMAQAPVTVFVYRPNRTEPWPASSKSQHLSDVVDVQSVGACIENMVLMAEEMGIGSLWICDVFAAYEELNTWLGESTEMIAAVCFGYADEHPVARKRKSFDDVVHWL